MRFLPPSNSFLTITFLAVVLSACGSSGPGNDGIGFGFGPSGGGGDDIINASDCTLRSGQNAEINITPVEVRGTNGFTNLSSSTKLLQNLFEFVTPAPAYAFQGLSSIDGAIIDVELVEIRLGTGPNTTLDSAFRENGLVIEEEDGLFLICFGTATTPGQRIDLAIKATIRNSARDVVTELYAPFRPSLNNSIRVVDISTDFIVRRLFDNIVSSEQLDELVETQTVAKASMLSRIARDANSFDIAFNNEDTKATAVQKLLDHPSYVHVVDEALEQILRDPPEPLAPAVTVVGTDPNSGLQRTCLTEPFNEGYNASFFRFGLSEFSGIGHTLAVNSAISDNVPVGEVNPITALYPQLNRQIEGVNQEQNELLVPVLPFLTEQAQFNGTGFILDQSEFYHFFSTPDSSLTSVENDQTDFASDGFLTTLGSITFSRSIPAFIPRSIEPDTSGVDTNGWSQDPVFSNLYSSSPAVGSLNTSDECELQERLDATWLSTAYYGSGNIYDQPNTGSFSRGDLTESHQYFSWEVYGLRSTENVQTTDISGKSYGVVSFGLLLDDSAPFITVSTDVSLWDASSSNLEQTQPNAHYENRTLARTSSTVTTSTGPVQLDEDNRPYELVEGDVNNLINLSVGINNIDAEGHVTLDGDYLSFVQENPEKGRGLILAMILRADPPEFSEAGDRYLLQGNAIEMDGELNRFRNITGSTLTIRADTSTTDVRDCIADIQLEQIGTQFSFIDPSPAVVEETITTATSSLCTINNNTSSEIEIRFDSLLTENEEVTLKGFVSEEGTSRNSTPGNLMTLIWAEENGLGLVLAQKDLSE